MTKPSSAPGEASAGSGQTGPLILVIDDEPGLRTLIQGRLEKEGFQCDTAANGMQALQKLRSGVKPELVICDIKMPGMTAPELLAEVRKDPQLKSLPFLIMTAYAEKPLIVEAAKYGVVDLMLKPFQHRDMMAKIRSFFGSRLANPTQQAA
jgi:CheY-like chemotaxis protein